MKISISLPKKSKNTMNYRVTEIKNFEYPITLCISCGFSQNYEELSKIFSENELQKFNSFGSEKRKLHFLLGRYSAKQALLSKLNKKSTDLQSASFNNISSMNDINICAGIFGQPIFENPKTNLDLSISHSGLYGGAVVFDRKFPCGFDLQQLNESRRDVLQKYIIGDELSSDSLIDLTAAWSLKESLSKALRCGLTVHPDILAIKNFQKNGAEFFCDFHNFPNFSGYAQLIDDTILSLVFPKL